MIVEVVPAALAGERLDRVVALLTGVSRAEATELVANGAVSVGGRVVTAKAARLGEGDEVAIDWEPAGEAPPPQPDAAVVVHVVHEDTDVLVIYKQPGLVVHPGHGTPDGTLVNGLLARYPELAEVGQPDRPGIVHRLDKETSGLLVVARTPQAYDDLVGQLAARTVDRRYLALVWGHPSTSTGRVDAPIGRSAREPTKMAVTERGKPAMTDFSVVRTFDEPSVALLECKLHTGRTHQIRVHLRAIGHPVVGDDRYGGVRQTLPVPRLFLHAAHLSFTHPVTGEELAFDSPLPADLQGVLDGLGGVTPTPTR